MAEGWAGGFWRENRKAILTSASGTNIWEGGFLRRKDTHKLVTTESRTGAKWSGGFLRSPIGALVIVNGGENPKWGSGFKRDKFGALEYVLEGGAEAPKRFEGGFWRDKKGRLIIG